MNSFYMYSRDDDILEIKESGKFEYVLSKRQPMFILN